MNRAPSTIGTPRGKPPKPRNTEARKEQNRIASRAYREKRKQKLALLDQILKPEDGDLSSSTSDAGDSQGVISASHSRRASRSPRPAHQSMGTARATTTMWPPAEQTLAGTSNFGGESFDDLWMSDFDRNNVMFGASHDFVTAFPASDLASMGAAAQFQPHLPPMASMSSMPVDPVLAGPHADSYSKHLRNAPGTEHGTPQLNFETPYESDSESAMAAALDSFSRLNAAQQQKMINIIHKRRRMSVTVGPDQSWDMPVEYPVPVTPPADMQINFLSRMSIIDEMAEKSHNRLICDTVISLRWPKVYAEERWNGRD